MPAHQRRTWYGLTRRQQREVLRAARRGESHTDAALADAVRRWAQEVLEPKYSTIHGAIGVALAAVSDVASGGWLGMLAAERRAARRILAARPPEPTQDRAGR